MGIDDDGLRFLQAARRSGVDFTRTCTIGRQSNATAGGSGYADELLADLGAASVASLDASGYEDATIIHDLNSPSPPPAERFSMVIDGGSLEHIFHVPNALRSILGLVDVGGHVAFINPMNGHPGHGFYQFSPEFWFRALSPSSGFVVRRCLLKEYGSRRPWFEVPDPADLGRRLIPRTRGIASLYVLAERVKERPLLAEAPQQSDYVATWTGTGGRAAKLLESVPERWRPALLNGRETLLRLRGPSSVGLQKVDP